ncbi:MAG: DGQHR domain-containing protein [Thermoplasmatales archaeon]|nr:DGQHR domain-containing protein [Thermoplasmatales archaeon]
MLPVPQAGGRVQYVTSLSAEKVHDLFSRGLLKVDEWSSTNQDGYQRSPVQSRYRRFSRFVRDPEGWSPASVLLFLRWPDRLETESSDGGVLTVRLRLDKDHPLYIPDGQHRLLGLDFAYNADPTEVGPYCLPAVLMTALPGTDSRYEEATQFYVINSNQKRVATDLAQRYRLRVQEKLLSTKIDKGAVLPPNVSNTEIIPFCVAVIDRLNANTAGPWHQLIDLPNSPGSGRPISQNAFLNSITALVQFGADYGWTVGKVAETIEAYWTAISKLCPAASAHWNDDGHTTAGHKTYVLRTTNGVWALNELLPWLVGWHKIQKDPTDPTVYQRLLETDSEHFSDAYWESGNADGAGARGTSHVAFNETRKEIMRELAQHLNEL